MSHARGPDRPSPSRALVLECLEDRCLPSAGFSVVGLASDVPGLARSTDPNLVNPWGLAASPTGPFWFADNGTGLSDLLDGRGQAMPMVVRVPGTPTGTVFNGGPGFEVWEGDRAAPARFLFASEDGTISGWSARVDPTAALVAVDDSAAGAVYKGLTVAADRAGHQFLYAADFGRGEVDVFDSNFRPVLTPGAFRDPNLPSGFAPFNIQDIDGRLFVTYARPDASRRDDLTGPGSGYVDVYDTAGRFLWRFASAGPLDAPWGLALAPAGFGPFGGDLLVGNTGDGRVNAFDPRTGAFRGALADAHGNPIVLPNLWALAFGNGHDSGDADTLFFTAGLDHEWHGLFGAIQPPGRAGADTGGRGTFDPSAPGEVRDYPLPPRAGPTLHDPVPNAAATPAVLLPLAGSSLALVPTLSAPTVAESSQPGPAVPVAVVPPPGSTGAALTGHAPAYLALHSFLDLTPSPAGTETRGQPPEPDAVQVAAEVPVAFLTGDPGEMELLRAELPAQTGVSTEIGPEGPKVVRADFSGPPAFADTPGADAEMVRTGPSHPRRLWSELVKALFVAVSVPMAWGICRGTSGRGRFFNNGVSRANKLSNQTPVQSP